MTTSATKTTAAGASTKIFEEAFETFEAALKNGVKVQEETTQWWLDRIGEVGSPQEWQKRFQTLLKDAVPTSRKNIDEAISLMNQNSKTSLELFQKACEAGQSESPSGAQDKTRQLWEASLAALRTNTQALAQANGRMLEACVSLAKASDGPSRK